MGIVINLQLPCGEFLDQMSDHQFLKDSVMQPKQVNISRAIRVCKCIVSVGKKSYAGGLFLNIGRTEQNAKKLYMGMQCFNTARQPKTL